MREPYDRKDFERRIADWRHLTAERIDDADTLDELEDHLREALAESLDEHADLDAAWSAATSELGDCAALGSEFSKLLGPSRLDRNVLRGVMGVGALCGLGLALAGYSGAMSDTSNIWLALHVGSISLGYVAALTLSCVGLFIAARRLTVTVV